MIKKYPELLFVVTLIILTLIYIVYYELSITEPIVARELPGGKLTGAQLKSIETILELAHLMIGWAVAIIGATAFFIKFNVEKDIPVKRVDLCISSIVVISSVLSLYFGHLGIYYVSELLSFNQFPIGNKIIKEMFQRQYIMVLTATGLFGFYVIFLCWRLVSK